MTAIATASKMQRRLCQPRCGTITRQPSHEFGSQGRRYNRADGRGADSYVSLGRIPAWLRANRRYLPVMKQLLLPAVAAGLLAIGCQKPSSDGSSADSKPAPIDPSKSAVSGNPAMAPVEYGGALAKGKKSSEAKLAIAEFEKAIQMFEAAESRKPANLEELLKTGYLTRMPKTPYGMKFTYDAKTGKVDAVMAK